MSSDWLVFAILWVAAAAVGYRTLDAHQSHPRHWALLGGLGLCHWPLVLTPYQGPVCRAAALMFLLEHIWSRPSHDTLWRTVGAVVGTFAPLYLLMPIYFLLYLSLGVAVEGGVNYMVLMYLTTAMNMVLLAHDDAKWNVGHEGLTLVVATMANCHSSLCTWEARKPVPVPVRSEPERDVLVPVVEEDSDDDGFTQLE